MLYDTPDDPRNYPIWVVSGGTGAPSGFQSWELVSGTVTKRHLHGMNFVLPDDLTDTSASGLLLTGPVAVASVLEPETYGLMLAGFGVMARVARRHRLAA